MLVVVGSQASDPRVKAEEELEELEQRFWPLRHQIEHLVLPRPARTEILNTCEKFAPTCFTSSDTAGRWGDPAVLELSGQQPPDSGANEMYSDLAPAAGLRFAFLNACHTAAVPGQQVPGSEIWSLHQTFFDLGARAVLAMQGPVPGHRPRSCRPRCTRRWLPGNRSTWL